MAPYVLHWQSMLDAKEAGQEEYDFWGVESAWGKIPGFARFKTGFGGQIKNYPGAFDIIQGKNWHRLYRVLKFFGPLVR